MNIIDDSEDDVTRTEDMLGTVFSKTFSRQTLPELCGLTGTQYSEERRTTAVEQHRSSASSHMDDHTNHWTAYHRSNMIDKNTEFRRTETLIVLDWDDTLFPLSWLLRRTHRKSDGSVDDAHHRLSADEQHQLDGLGDTACALLQTALQLGRVIILTNAEGAWVHRSAAKYFPKLLSMLTLWHVSIVSARAVTTTTTRTVTTTAASPVKGRCQHFRCDRGGRAALSSAPIQTKLRAFQQILDLAYPSQDSTLSCNVVSIGDSHWERYAVMHSIAKRLIERPTQLSLYKSLKLCERPTPQLLQQQLCLVEMILPLIVHYMGNVDLRVDHQASFLDASEASCAS